jgi:hypothetical protein
MDRGRTRGMTDSPARWLRPQGLLISLMSNRQEFCISRRDTLNSSAMVARMSTGDAQPRKGEIDKT